MMQYQRLIFVIAGMLAASDAVADDILVSIEARAYQTAHITMRIGDTVEFVNNDTEGHAVFVPNAGYALDLGNMDPGAKTAFTAQKPGVFDVECVYHADMKMTVEVK